MTLGLAQGNLHSRTSRHSLHPSIEMGVILHIVLGLVKDDANDIGPGNKGEVGKRVLSTHKPRAVLPLLLGKDSFQDARHAVDLLDVALKGTGELLRVELLEPRRLAVVWALAGGLEVEILLGSVRVQAASREADFVVCVVLLRQVFDDGARLPKSQAGVGVVNGWQTAIGVDCQVLGLLDIGEGDGLYLVGDAKLLQHDDHLGRVGATLAVQLDGLEGRHGVCVYVCIGVDLEKDKE